VGVASRSVCFGGIFSLINWRVFDKDDHLCSFSKLSLISFVDRWACLPFVHKVLSVCKPQPLAEPRYVRTALWFYMNVVTNVRGFALDGTLETCAWPCTKRKEHTGLIRRCALRTGCQITEKARRARDFTRPCRIQRGGRLDWELTTASDKFSVSCVTLLLFWRASLLSRGFGQKLATSSARFTERVR